MTDTQSLATGLASSEGRRIHPRQFRITQLQVINWGPFENLHSYPFPDRGLLITGQSGTGKSTLQDAISTLLFATGRQAYNASAAEGEFGGRDGDRDLAGYVRGIYGSDVDGSNKYLRGGGPTWSAIGCTWETGEGKIVTAVALFHYADAAVDTASMVKTYTLHERHFDIAELEQLYGQNNFRRDRIKTLYPEPESHYPRSFAEYQATLMRLLGIRADAGLSLLARAKAAKNIGSLDAFVRGSMLERPTTFDIAERLCTDFTEIDQLYRTVLDQKARVDHLAPVPELYSTYQNARDQNVDAERLLSGPLGVYALGLRDDLIDARLDTIEVEQLRLAEVLAEHDRIIAAGAAHVEALADQIRDLDGGAFQRLEQAVASAAEQLTRTRTRSERFAQQCIDVDYPIPGSLAEYQKVKTDAEAEQQTTAVRLPAATLAANTAGADLSDARRALSTCENELRSLESRQSLIPDYQYQIRQQIADATGVAVEDMPYAAELIDIKPEQRYWQLAAERVLRSFGLNLLVPHRHIEIVKTYVNDHDMRGRVTLSEVPSETERRVQPRERDTLLTKIDLATHPMTNWVWNRIANSYAAVCVSSPAELQRHQHAVTAQGLEQMRGRYTKNDDPRFRQRTSWILGFDNKAKIAAYRDQQAQLQEDVSANEAAADDAAKERDALLRRHAQLGQLADALPWTDLDVRSYEDEHARLTEILDAARPGNERIIELREQLQTDRELLETKRDARAADKVLADSHARDGDALLDQRKQIQDRLAAATPPSDEDRALLQHRFANREITLERLDAVHADVRQKITEEIAKAREARDGAKLTMEKLFTGYLATWTEEAVDLKDDVSYAPEYVARYQDIMNKGLPQRQELFRQRLDNDAVERLVLLLQAIDDERKSIRRRIAHVNTSLAGTVYNTTDGGTYLSIDYTESPPVDAKTFRTHVTQAFGDAGAAPDDRQRKRQFDALRAIIARFTDPEDRRWKENVLDVRKAFAFHGKELNAAGETVRSWWNTNSNSGGEQEKIVAFCLAAALSYQLSDDNDDYPRFGSVMLDEAFSKSDETFTDQAMSAFTAFGFQLVLAAPVRMAPVLEPYLGGLMLVKKAEDPSTRRIASEGFYMPISELIAEFGGDVSEID
jgi:uncharacterized protein YPO0396